MMESIMRMRMAKRSPGRGEEKIDPPRIEPMEV
jgi:hypothetical protein